MGKYAIPTIEVIALIACVIFGVLWLNNPNGSYEPLMAISGLVFIATEGIRRYRENRESKVIPKKHSLIEINSKNTLFARFIDKSNKMNGNIGIAFYCLNIVNVSNDPYTVKDVVLRYKIDNDEYSMISNVLLTGMAHSPKAKEDVNAIIIEIGSDSIVLMGWDNIRTELTSLKTLQPGGVLSGSAYYVFEFDDIEKVRLIENVELVVIDYSGRESNHPIDIQEDWIIKGRNASMCPRSFVSDAEDNIKFI